MSGGCGGGSVIYKQASANSSQTVTLGDDVKPCIRVDDCRGQRYAGVARKHGRDSSDFFDRDEMLRWRMRADFVQQCIEMVDTGCGTCLYGACGDGMDMDAACRQIDGEITHARFERCLDRSHDVVVADRPIGPVKR